MRSPPGLCRAGLCGWNANGKEKPLIPSRGTGSLNAASWLAAAPRYLPPWSVPGFSGHQRWELQPSKDWNLGWSPKLWHLLVCCSCPWWKQEVLVPNPCLALPGGCGWQVPAGNLLRLPAWELKTCLEICLQMPGQWPLPCSWSTAMLHLPLWD